VCGIAGFQGPPAPEILDALSASMRHRGPDDHGAVTDGWASIASRRLSIVDLEHGHQPMSTADGRLHIAYNGEVYNFRELREELRGRGATFATESDTEVVLKAYELDGRSAFRRFNGMFALALLDLRSERPELVLARDHFGIKPLYHARVGDRVFFSSEVKSLLSVPGFRARPNEQRLYEYLRWSLHDHDEATFFEGVRSVEPATCLTVRDDGEEVHRYWEPRLSEDGDPSPERFRELFRRAVERRLVADVRVGTCLSGGLDSSSIVCMIAALIREHSPDAASVGEHLETFSAVFPGDPIDERPWIDAVLEASGARGNFVAPDSAEFVRELGDLVWSLDEPVVSSGPYAQWCVMRLAHGRVKVLLDGQGGDELLGGYVPYRFVYLRQLLRQRRFGRLAREGLGRQELRMLAQRFLPRPGRASMNPVRYLRAAFVDGKAAPRDERVTDDLKKRLLLDLTTYSLPSLLRYEDRNSMAHSIEARPPLLDLELVEHALSLPADALMHRGRSRVIFREAMRGLLPALVLRRRTKTGFTTPEMRWLERERASMTGILRSPSFLTRPYWDGAAIADAFEAACEGRMEQSLFFWRVLNTELWLRVFIDRSPATASVRPGRDWESIGDEMAVALAGSVAAATALAGPAPPGRHRFIADGNGRILARSPLDGGPEQMAATLVDGDVVVVAAAAGIDVERLRAAVPDGVTVAILAEPGGSISQPSIESGGGASSRTGLAAVLAAAMADDPMHGAEHHAALRVREVGRLPRPVAAERERRAAGKVEPPGSPA